MLPARTCAGPGALDVSFNRSGIVATDLGVPTAIAEAIAIQDDGKIVAAGYAESADASGNIAIVRYRADGSFDTSFNGTGIVITDIGEYDSGAFGIAIQSDGKIVVAGGAYLIARYSMMVARYNTDGSLDTTFNGTGIVQTFLGTLQDRATCVAIQSDGKIVVGGDTRNGSNRDFAAVRYLTSGSLDLTFNGTGIVITPLGPADDTPGAISIQPDGKIVAAGTSYGAVDSDIAVVRYNSDGSLDSTFNGTGSVVTPIGSSNDYGSDLVLQPDGKLVVGGVSIAGQNVVIAMVRYNPDGTLDHSFGTAGKLTTQIGDYSECRSLGLQRDGKLVVAGQSRLVDRLDLTVVRYLANGDLDLSFNGNGHVTTEIEQASQALALAIQRDEKIVVAGVSIHMGTGHSFVVARYLGTTYPFDYDGDGRTDLSVYRPSTGAWYLLQSFSGFTGIAFGNSTDRIVPADYDGDGKTDVAVYRPSEGAWYILNSSNNTLSAAAFGIAEDLPAPADYDGDGRADLTVFRPSTAAWYRLNSSNGAFIAVQFGATGDKPTVGDFDGDGKADLAVYRPSAGAWYRLNSSNGAFVPTQFGVATDLTVPADYDGDGKTDLAVYRASEGAWYWITSSNGAFVATNFGTATDIPAPGDFDGDGKADLSVFRPSDGAWYRLNSSNGGFVIQPFGQNGDRPTPSAFSY